MQKRPRLGKRIGCCLLLPALACALLPFSTVRLARASPSAGNEDPLNIVLIVGDDHAWNHAGFLGHEIALTPNLDRIAQEGTVFRNAHNPASSCVPSLRTLLSGLHPLQWEARRAALEEKHGPLPRRTEVRFIPTLPRLLALRGYASFQGGKMWEGTWQQAGFSAGMATTIGTLFETVGQEFGRTGIDAFREFLDTTGPEPFFAWLAPMLPHTPHDAGPAFREPFENRGLAEEAIGYFANLLRLDFVVGEIVAELAGRELLDRTLLVYLSDNGWEIGQRFGVPGKGKTSLYETGVRTMLIFRLPGTVTAGVLRDDLVSTEDVVPTLLESAGLRPPRNLPGRSLRAGLVTPAPVGRSHIVSEQIGTRHAPGGRWVRTPTWRYVHATNRDEELYAIGEDPGETRNLASEFPELLRWFRATHALWRQELERHRTRSVACRQASRAARQCARPNRAPAALTREAEGTGTKWR